MDIGERIAGWRRHRGLTMQELADLIGKSSAAISQFENGDNAPSTETLGKIVDAFRLTMAQFYGRVPAASKAG